MKLFKTFFRGFGLFVLGLSILFYLNKTFAGGELPGVEYYAVCKNLPANAHRTSATKGTSVRMEIPQTETLSNIWTPSPVGTFNDTDTSGTTCYFVCDEGYEWDDGQECVSSFPAVGITTGTDLNGNGYIAVSDGNQYYTIMDRNVGATVAGTGKKTGDVGCTSSSDCRDASFGNYFQWGNNYGFPSSGTLFLSGTTKPDASLYGASAYSSGYYVKAGSDWSSVRNDNLRGGIGDTQSNRAGKDTDRQGPCPVGYHVPSAYEWGGLLQTWYSVNSGAIGGILQNTGTGLPYISTGSVGEMFRNDFLLPLAGYRSCDSSATIYYQGAYAYYWSSSPFNPYARGLYFSPSYVSADYSYNRAIGFAVRCFQNSQ